MDGGGAEAGLGGRIRRLDSHLDEDVGSAVGGDLGREHGGLSRQAGRCRAESDDAGPREAVELLVSQGHGVAGDDGRHDVSPRGAAGAADLEHVAEVGGEFQDQGNQRLFSAEADQGHPLVEAGPPQQAGTPDVDDGFRRRWPAQGRQGRVGQVRGEQDIVLTDRPPEQHQRLAGNAQAQPGEDPGVVVEQAVAGTMDVAITVADEEHVAVLQDERAEPSGRLAWLVRLDGGTDIQLTSPSRRGAVADRVRPAYSRQ